MKYLLDTHILLWAAIVPEKLPSTARQIIEDLDNELFFSPASIWEVSIKSQLERTDFTVDPGVLRRALLDNGFIEINIRSEHAVELGFLPDKHKDPFDRMLIAQANYEGLTLVTSDELVSQYPGAIKKV